MRAVVEGVGSYESGARRVAQSTEDINRANRRAADSSRSLDQTLRTTGTRMSEAGRQAAFLGAATVGAAAGPAFLAAQFDSSLLRIETLVGIAREEVAGFREDILALSGETAQAPQDLAEALFVVTSAGARGQEALDILRASAQAAAVGLGNTADIARTVTQAVTAFRDQGLSAAAATDVLTATVREGNLSAAELAGSLGRVLGPASAVGVSFADVGAFVATFTRVAGDSAEATTALRGLFTALIRPTTDAEEALEAVGLSGEQLRQSLRDRGLVQTLITLNDAFAGNTVELARVIPNVRALTGVLSTVGAQQEEFLRISDSVAESQGTLAEAFERTTEDSLFQFRQALTEAQAAAIDFGGEALPIFTDLIRILGLVVDGFAALPGPVQQAAAAIAVFGGGFTLIAGTAAVLVGNIIRVTAEIISMTRALGAARVASIALATTGIFALGALAVGSVLALSGAMDALSGSTAEAAEEQSRLARAIEEVTTATEASLAAQRRSLEAQRIQAEIARDQAAALRSSKEGVEEFARENGLAVGSTVDFQRAVVLLNQEIQEQQGIIDETNESLAVLTEQERLFEEASSSTVQQLETERRVREQLIEIQRGQTDLTEEQIAAVLEAARALGIENDSLQENGDRLQELAAILNLVESGQLGVADAALAAAGALDAEATAASNAANALAAVNRARIGIAERQALEERVREGLRGLDTPEARRLLGEFTPDIGELPGGIDPVEVFGLGEFGPDVLAELPQEDLEALANALGQADEDARRAESGVAGVIDTLRSTGDIAPAAAAGIDAVAQALEQLAQRRLREQVAGLTREILGIPGDTLTAVRREQAELDRAFAEVAPFIAERLGVVPTLFRDVVEQVVQETENEIAEQQGRLGGIGGLIGLLIARRLDAGLDPGGGLIAAPGERGIGRGPGSGAENLITIEEINVGTGAQTTVAEIATGVDSGVAGALREQS